MNSDYCYGIEMKRAMERHQHNEARVIPIILRSTFWQNAPFSKLQFLPKDGKPVLGSDWRNQDEAFTNVVDGIDQVVRELIKQVPVDDKITPLLTEVKLQMVSNKELNRIKELVDTEQKRRKQEKRILAIITRVVREYFGWVDPVLVAKIRDLIEV